MKSVAFGSPRVKYVYSSPTKKKTLHENARERACVSVFFVCFGALLAREILVRNTRLETIDEAFRPRRVAAINTFKCF